MNCEHCGKQIETTQKVIMGQAFDIPKDCQCVVDKRNRENAELVNRARPIYVEHIQKLSGLPRMQRGQTFESFKVQPGQEEAYRLALEFCDGFGSTPIGLYLGGGQGSGKTHLASAILNRLIQKIEITPRVADDALYGDLGFKYCKSPYEFITEVELYSKLKSTFDTQQNSSDIVRRYSQTKLLVLDDIGVEKPSDFTLQTIFEIINYRYNEMLPTIVTSNIKPKALGDKIGTRVADRIREVCKYSLLTCESQRNTA